MKVHDTITPDRVMEAVQRYHASLDNPGFCIQCGAEVDGVEPDAEEYECEICGEPGVYALAHAELTRGVLDLSRELVAS